MKNLVVLLSILSGFVLFSCGENSSAYKNLKAQYDSIATLEESLALDLSQTDSLVASVLVNFQDIESIESMININPRRGEFRRSERERIKDNMKLISEKLKANGDALEALNKKLVATEKSNQVMLKTLIALGKVMNTQKSRILKLEKELKKRNIVIGELDAMVNGLNRSLESLSEQKARQQRELKEQDIKLNRVRYCIGTKQDLKDLNILRKGKVLSDNANQSYFTNADLRDLSQILTYSKHAKLLTAHPEKSYSLRRDNEGYILLKIEDPKTFWSYSKTLVIQVK